MRVRLWVAFVVFTVLYATIGSLVLTYVKAPLPPVPVVDLKRLDELEVRVKSLEDKRGLSIHPQNLSVYIYPVENLGRRKP